MKSTIEAFGVNEKGQFKVISEYALARIEEGIFKATQEYLKRALTYADVATCAMPWGTYTASNRKGSAGGNMNIELNFSEDFQEAIDDPKNQKAVYLDEFSSDPEHNLYWVKLFDDFTTYGRFFDPDTEDAKKSADVEKGVSMTDFQMYYFPNSYAMMLVKAVRDHKADGEIYKIDLCDTVRHGTLEFEYNGDDVKAKFYADKAFKQYLKDDEISDE